MADKVQFFGEKWQGQTDTFVGKVVVKESHIRINNGNTTAVVPFTSFKSAQIDFDQKASDFANKVRP